MRRRELAAHMQRAEATMVGTYLMPDPRRPRLRASATRRIGGVICLAARGVDVPFLGRALGVGTIADATPGLLDRIERHYASLGRASRIAIASESVPVATLRMLERRGYAPDEGSPVLVYGYDRRRPPDVPVVAGLTIELVGPAGAGLYARTGYESFSERGPRFVATIEALVRARRRGLRSYLGRIDGEPAATGMLMDVAPVGGMMNGSVRARFRGRGIQKALLAYRIRDGWRRGYRLFFGETENAASAHNMEALGWRKLYDEVTWERQP